MKPPDTIYRGGRYPHGGVWVTVGNRELKPDVLRDVLGYIPSGFAWGYRGAGPLRLALALILDATGSLDLARRAYHWFTGGPVCCWGDSWQITAGEIRAWLAQFERECREEPDACDDADQYEIVVADPEQHSVYHGPLQCPGCNRVADEVEWPTKGGIRHCPVCAKKRGPRLMPVPLPVAKGGAA